MDIYNFESEVNYLSSTGGTLSTEERVVLHNALVTVQDENHFNRVFFWGKILGTDTDYFMAYGYRKDVVHDKIFYYSTNCRDWVLLPKPEPIAQKLSLISQTRFQGDPSLVLNVTKEGFSGFETGTEGSPEALLKEENRLSATVHAITDAIAVVPRGAIVTRVEDCRAIWNPLFKGLEPDKAALLPYWLHLRDPKNRWNTCLLTAKSPNPVVDCLDSIDNDFPPGCWNAQLLSGGRIAVVKNLLWPGSAAYHLVNTPIHGYMYLGTGKYNLDFPFMV